ncbi:MAG: general secretion pathway protein GspB [Syntrophaceae bacterium]
MSLILDALRKLDREQNAGGAGKRNIAAEMLKDGDPPRRSGMLPLAIAIGITASVAALATYVVIGGSGSRTAIVSAKAPAAPSHATQAVTAPPPSMPAEVPVKPPSPQVTAPTSPPDAASPAKQPGRAKDAAEPAARGRTSGRQELAAKAPARSETGTASRPAVKISAIIWQEEPLERKAMINGRVARQGDLVDGMKVLEIHPSHVKLSYDGKAFKAGMFE